MGLINPVNQGGWLTRMSLLSNPEACEQALDQLSSDEGEKPTPLRLLEQVDLAIACGRLKRAAELLAALRASSDPFLRDVAHHEAIQLTLRRSRSRPDDQELVRFQAELEPYCMGLVPAGGR